MHFKTINGSPTTQKMIKSPWFWRSSERPKIPFLKNQSNYKSETPKKFLIRKPIKLDNNSSQSPWTLQERTIASNKYFCNLKCNQWRLTTMSEFPVTTAYWLWRRLPANEAGPFGWFGRQITRLACRLFRLQPLAFSGHQVVGYSLRWNKSLLYSTISSLGEPLLANFHCKQHSRS